MHRTLATTLACLALTCLAPLSALAHVPAGTKVYSPAAKDSAKKTGLTIRLDLAGHPAGMKWKLGKESRGLGIPIHDLGPTNNYAKQTFHIETKDLAPGAYQIKFVGKVPGSDIRFVHQLAFDKEK